MTIRLKSVKNSPQTSFPSLRFLFLVKLLEACPRIENLLQKNWICAFSRFFWSNGAILILIFFLSSCGYKDINLKAISSQYNDVISQNIRIDTGKEVLSIVCFTEIKTSIIQGLSCQNDTGFHLFSGGLKNNDRGEQNFKLEKLSSFIFKIEPQLILSYIKISLFSEYELNERKVMVTKDSNQTLITDNKNKLSVVIIRL